jgi:hypothetical protein
MGCVTELYIGNTERVIPLVDVSMVTAAGGSTSITVWMLLFH